MNCKQSQNFFLAMEEGVPLPEVEQHLASCPTCRAQYESFQAVRKLVSLKKYELPDAGFESRCAAAIHLQLVEQEQNRPEAAGWLGRIFGTPLPMFRYAAAAVFGLFVLFQVLPMTPLAPLTMEGSDESVAPSLEMRKPIVVLSATTTDMAAPALAATLPGVSNRGPSRVEYGPGMSVPVSLEY